MTAAADKAADTKAKKVIADAEAEAKKIIEDAEATAKGIVEEAESKVAELKETSDETEEKSSVNDKFNALWAQINEEYEEDTLRQTVLAQLEALQFAAKGLDD